MSSGVLYVSGTRIIVCLSLAKSRIEKSRMDWSDMFSTLIFRFKCLVVFAGSNSSSTNIGWPFRPAFCLFVGITGADSHCSKIPTRKIRNNFCKLFKRYENICFISHHILRQFSIPFFDPYFLNHHWC